MLYIKRNEEITMKAVLNPYFYGWYFRCCQEDGIHFAVIPAIHGLDREGSCSIQIVTESGSWRREFPIEMFRISKDRTRMKIGNNLFSHRGIILNFEADDLRVEGRLRFGNFAKPKYDIMGPFCLVPGMECRHAVYSMEHSVCGEVRLNGRTMYFDNGKGYMEGDRGTSFPADYIWTQHFFREGSLMVAAASLPLGNRRFTGTTGFLYHKGKEYRFATYLGAAVEKMEERQLQIRQGKYRLNILLQTGKGNLLNAPVRGKMTRSIRENICCKAEYILQYKDRILFREVTDQAAVECETAG